MTEGARYRDVKKLTNNKSPTRKTVKKLIYALTPPLISLSLIVCPPTKAEKVPEESPPSEIAKNKLLESEWSKGACVFNENEWSISYKSKDEINGKKEAKLDLNSLEDVGTPEKVICGDSRSYIITSTHVLITLGGMRAFEDHVMLGMVGDDFVAGNIMGIDIGPIAKQGILLSLVVPDGKNDNLYLFTKYGKLWEIPLVSSSKASCAFTSKYLPTGKVAITTYRGLLVLVKEGNENIVLVESAKDEFISLPYKSKEWVKGDISVNEEKDHLKVRIGKKEYVVKVPKEGKVATAVVEENVYKGKKENEKW
jgi:hypothetical protein